jgi:hypothetical protein
LFWDLVNKEEKEFRFNFLVKRDIGLILLLMVEFDTLMGSIGAYYVIYLNLSERKSFLLGTKKLKENFGDAFFGPRHWPIYRVFFYLNIKII